MKLPSWNRTYFYLIIAILMVNLSTTACRKPSVDQKRDKMVAASTKIKKVLGQQLGVSQDRLLINQKLGHLGINEENKLKIQAALEKELELKIPYQYLSEKSTVGTLVRFAAGEKAPPPKKNQAEKLDIDFSEEPDTSKSNNESTKDNSAKDDEKEAPKEGSKDPAKEADKK